MRRIPSAIRAATLGLSEVTDLDGFVIETSRDCEGRRFEFATDRVGGQLTCAMARDHDQRNSRIEHRSQHQAVGFAHAALDKVSDHRAAHASRDRDPEARFLVSGKPSRIEHEVRALDTRPMTLQITELGAVMEAVGGREARGPTRARQPGCLAGMSIASRWRPLARRRLSTLRPPEVAMRAMNPWVRFLRRLWGW